MRIITKFKDYYDSGLMYGIDLERVWVREEKVFGADELEIKFRNNHSWSHNSQNPLGFVGFCGKIYPFLNINYLSVPSYQYDKNQIFYDITSIKSNIYYDRITRKLPPLYRHVGNRIFKVDMGSWDTMSFNQKIEDLTKNKKLLELFLKYKTPVFVGENILGKGYQITMNAKLKEYAFFKVKNEIQTFSEIEQFIGNILVGEKEVKIPTGDDKVIAASKGFDKWSFRKEPTK